MKTLTLFLFIAPLLLKAQTSVYHPVPDSSANWNFQRDVPCGPVLGYTTNYSLTISGDTSINSQTYHKLTKPSYNYYSTATSCTGGEILGYIGAYRQEIINKKVYFIPPSSSLETLLYDFNMQVGDTVKGHIEEFASPKDTVISIDSILIGSGYRKRWKINQDYNIYFIEGIGSTLGLIEYSPAGLIGSFGTLELTCFNQNAQSLYPDTLSNCQLISSVNSINEISNQIEIFPNPSNGLFTINFNETKIKEIRLYDILGNILFHEKSINLNEYQINNLKSGLYILTIIDKDNKIINKKLISRP